MTVSPNPFTPKTKISFSLPIRNTAIPISLKVFDIEGKLVKTLFAGRVEDARGLYEVFWKGNNNSGQQVSSGLYIVKLNVGDKTMNRAVLLMR